MSVPHRSTEPARPRHRVHPTHCLIPTQVDALLKEAGTSKSHALSATIWLKDINRDFKGMNEVWNAWVDPENKPVRATVEAAMARPVLLVEIQVTAALDKSPFEDLNY